MHLMLKNGYNAKQIELEFSSIQKCEVDVQDLAEELGLEPLTLRQHERFHKSLPNFKSALFLVRP